MEKTRTVSLKALFFVTCFLKVSSSAIGWALDRPWTFGLILPLAFMLAYIFVGYRFRDREVSLEKFADSCYYLGFIFTIVSIIFSLIDIPNIGSDMTTIAVRFGAAMASTVFGLFVRVFLVNFRPNAEDAVQRVEDQVVDSARRLSGEFDDAFDDLRDFRGKVSTAARETVALVDTQFETMMANNRARTDAFFDEMSRLNRESMLEAIQEIRTASTALVRVIGHCEESLRGSISRIDSSVDGFSRQLIGRLDALEFPEDIFSRKLESPISSLNGSTAALMDGVRKVSGDVLEAARAVDNSVEQINLRTESMIHVLDTVHQLTAQQERLASLMKAQQESLADRVRLQQEAVSQGLSRQTEALAAIASAFGNLDLSMKRMAESQEQVAEQIRQVQHAGHDTEARLAEIIERLESRETRRFEQFDKLGHAIERLERLEAMQGDAATATPASKSPNGRSSMNGVDMSPRRDVWAVAPSTPAPKPD